MNISRFNGVNYGVNNRVKSNSPNFGELIIENAGNCFGDCNKADLLASRNKNIIKINKLLKSDAFNVLVKDMEKDGFDAVVGTAPEDHRASLVVYMQDKSRKFRLPLFSLDIFNKKTGEDAICEQIKFNKKYRDSSEVTEETLGNEFINYYVCVCDAYKIGKTMYEKFKEFNTK